MQSHSEYSEHKMQTYRVAQCGVLTALALILSYVESLIPFYFGVPGMKLGLTNLVVVFALYELSWKDALTINIIRILLAGFLFGNMFSIVYSLSGGILSFIVMVCLKRTGRFSVTGTSIGGGIAHNIGQLAAACIVVSNYKVSFYAPALAAAGAVTGLIIGLVAAGVLKIIKKSHMHQQPEHLRTGRRKE